MSETDEQKQKDLESRVKKFNEEVMPLLNKYNLALAAQPFIAPNGLTLARPILVNADDLKQADEKPPEKPEEKKVDLAQP